MLQKSTTDKVLELFFKEPNKQHYLKEISRELDIAHTSVKRILNELLKNNLIKEEIFQRGRRSFPYYQASFNNDYYKLLKKLNNLKQLEKVGLIKYLQDKLMPHTIVLFGSYSRGEDLEESDIDLFIQTNKETIELKEFEKKLNRKIELHFKKDFQKYPQELKNNIMNGITLRGFLNQNENRNSKRSRKSQSTKKNGRFKSKKTKNSKSRRISQS